MSANIIDVQDLGTVVVGSTTVQLSALGDGSGDTIAAAGYTQVEADAAWGLTEPWTVTSVKLGLSQPSLNNTSYPPGFVNGIQVLISGGLTRTITVQGKQVGITTIIYGTSSTGDPQYTVTTSEKHGLAVNQAVTLSGFLNPAYNGTFRINTVTAVNKFVVRSFAGSTIPSSTPGSSGFLPGTTIRGFARVNARNLGEFCESVRDAINNDPTTAHQVYAKSADGDRLLIYHNNSTPLSFTFNGGSGSGNLTASAILPTGAITSTKVVTFGDSAIDVNNDTVDWVALQYSMKLVEQGTSNVIEFGAGKQYVLSKGISLPITTTCSNKQLTIHGNNSLVEPINKNAATFPPAYKTYGMFSGGSNKLYEGKLMYRWCPTQYFSENVYHYGSTLTSALPTIEIKDIEFVWGFKEAGNYSILDQRVCLMLVGENCIVKNCEFYGGDIGLDLQHAKQTIVDSCTARDNAVFGLAVRTGQWDNITKENSQSSNTILRDIRILSHDVGEFFEGDVTLRNTTSTSSLTIGLGSQTFTIPSGTSYAVGQSIIIFNSTNYMSGSVTAFSSGSPNSTVTVNVTTIGGSGTFASWTVGANSITGVSANTVTTIANQISAGRTVYVRNMANNNSGGQTPAIVQGSRIISASGTTLIMNQPPSRSQSNISVGAWTDLQKSGLASIYVGASSGVYIDGVILEGAPGGMYCNYGIYFEGGNTPSVRDFEVHNVHLEKAFWENSIKIAANPGQISYLSKINLIATGGFCKIFNHSLGIDNIGPYYPSSQNATQIPPQIRIENVAYGVPNNGATANREGQTFMRCPVPTSWTVSAPASWDLFNVTSGTSGLAAVPPYNGSTDWLSLNVTNIWDTTTKQSDPWLGLGEVYHIVFNGLNSGQALESFNSLYQTANAPYLSNQIAYIATDGKKPTGGTTTGTLSRFRATKILQ